MKDTVVLGGDHTITKQIDGDLNLLIGGFASSALLSILDGDIDLLQIVDNDSRRSLSCLRRTYGDYTITGNTNTSDGTEVCA